MKTRNAIAIGALVLFGSCMACSKIPSSTTPPTIEATVVRKTETQVPPTPTPPELPTATPAPLPTPTTPAIVIPPPSQTSAEGEYLKRISTISEEEAGYLEQVAQKMIDASTNTQLINDPKWIADVALLFTMIRFDNDAIRSLTPPAKFSSSHAAMVRMAGEIDAAVDDYIYGFDHVDAASLISGINHMNNATQISHEASSLLSEETK